MTRQRRYTIDEIDAMREAVKNLFQLSPSPKAAEVEDRLRTHMINGTDPDELVAAGIAHLEEEFRRLQENHRIERIMREMEEEAGKK